MKLYNKTSYKYTAFINGREYFVDKKATLEFECSEPTRIDLISCHKNRVFLNLLDVLLQMFIGDSTITLAYCDYSFLIQNCNQEVIVLKNNTWNPRDQLNIYSCYADADVTNENYSIHNYKRLKRKHRNMHIFVTSLPIIGILLLALALIFDPIPFIFSFFVWFVLFPVASVKEMKRFKDATEPDLINLTLRQYADERRKGKIFVSEDTSKTGKFFEKIIGKMFKFDEEK